MILRMGRYLSRVSLAEAFSSTQAFGRLPECLHEKLRPESLHSSLLSVRNSGTLMNSFPSRTRDTANISLQELLDLVDKSLQGITPLTLACHEAFKQSFKLLKNVSIQHTRPSQPLRHCVGLGDEVRTGLKESCDS